MSPTSSCDVLIIGAGPAGSAAAITLARAGREVVITDQCTFPRDKVCGDGLISDALNALRTLGVDEAVRGEAWQGEELRVYAPNGRQVALQGAFECLPRARLDEILLDAARQAGAVFMQAAAVSPLLDGSRVTGAIFRGSGETLEVRARMTILATGANASVLSAFGFGAKTKPHAIAGRAYFAQPASTPPAKALNFFYDSSWGPGYAWVFPSPGAKLNVGVYLPRSSTRRHDVRRFWNEFLRTPVADLAAPGVHQLSEFRGAPLRVALDAPQFGAEGLLLAGEAAGTTYTATGEGIGKALETGMTAAAFIDDSLRKGDGHGLFRTYGQHLQQTLGDRHRAYDRAERWAKSPRVLNALVKRANRGRFLRRELESLLSEQGDPLKLFSAVGLLRAFLS